MNIFVTSHDPIQSALWLDDVRVRKMTLETAQLLSTAVLSHYPEAKGLYKPTHVNHPCNIWTRKTIANFCWLVAHGIALNDIYRSHSGRDHKSVKIIHIAYDYKHHIPDGELTPFANCTNYKYFPTSHAYRRQMIDKWNSGTIHLSWNGRLPPTWYKPNE